MTRARTPDRIALVTALTGLVAFVALAWWLVPWHPVPGGTPAPVAAESVFSAAQIRRAEDYAWGVRILGWTSLAVSLVVACLLGLTRRGLRLVGRLRGWWWLRVVQAVVVVTLIGRLVTLPFAIEGQRRRLDAGLSGQAWSGWARDQAVGLGVSVLGTALVLVVLIGCRRRWPRWWSAIAGALAGLLVLLASFAYPVLIEPLFNRFEPLPDGALRTAVFRLADAEGVHIDDVLVADASRRTTTLNAYVSGFGDTRRVVVYDNVVDSLPEAETLSIIGHELGHAKHDDVLTGSVLGAFGAVAGVGLLGVLLGTRPLRRLLEPDGVEAEAKTGEPGAEAARLVRLVPLVLACLAIASLLASPVRNTVSRQIETRADVTALHYTRDPEAFEAMQQQLTLRALADPSPPALSQFWFGSHPTVLQRIAIAEQYRPDRSDRPDRPDRSDRR